MKKAIVGGLAVIVVIVALTQVFNVPLVSTAGQVVHPVGQWFYSAGQRLRSATSELSRLGNLQKELRSAESEVVDLRSQVVELERLREQNRQLRRDLEFARQSDLDTVGADIINYQPDGTRQMLRINVGSRDGIEPDMSVISEGVLVGVVKKASTHTSEVVLVSDINFRALVTIEGSSGVLRGQVGGGLLVERLPRNEGISEGDIVITSGQDGVHPAGLVVGTVRSYAEASGGVFITAQVVHDISPRELQTVMVVRR